MKISEALFSLRREQVLKGHSNCSIKNYRSCVERWLRHVAAGNGTDTESIRSYLYTMSESGAKNTTVNLHMDAIRFFYAYVLKDTDKMRNVKHLKTPKALPRIHSKEEIFEMIDLTVNPKHKFMLMVSYGCALRVNECVNLRVCDLNWDRMKLTIRTAKGRRDRVVNLDESMYIAFMNFAQGCGPLEYVFPGQVSGSLSKRSAEKIYGAACQRVGVAPTGFHTLRHSCITHMIENGVALEAVRQIVGHKSIKTTQGYIHLTDGYMGAVKSPLFEMNMIKGNYTKYKFG